MMADQASRLRELALNRRGGDKIHAAGKKSLKTLVVSSGKGGVGKSTISLNLSYCLAQQHHRILLLDADMGMGNIDIMLGIRPQYNLYHVVNGYKSIEEIIIPVTSGLDVIPGGSGIPELANMSNRELDGLFRELGKLEGQYDYMIIDTGAGISNQVLRFLLAADEVIIVTTPEPTSFTDAYGLIKSIHSYQYGNQIDLILNRVRSHSQGVALADKMGKISRQFLEREICFLGSICRDLHVEDYICNHQVIMAVAPNNPTARSIQVIARKLCFSSDAAEQSTGIKGYFKKILGIKALLRM
jgi:flagellar biosynthesis protein FlhG